tara:strand:+ start:1712 stop:2725 length:1014 start_codon:yes stop_codon:yes gene_type:complete
MSFHFCIIKKLKTRFTLKNIKPILIVPGEPNSIFFEIFFKSIKKRKYKSPLVLISSKKHLKEQIKKYKFKKKIKIIHTDKFSNNKLNNKQLNLINIDTKNFTFNKNKENNIRYINKTLNTAIVLLKKNFTNKILNGPINKNNYLNKKFQGMTEYFAKKTNSKKFAMIIFNKKLSVCPITTHLPLKLVNKEITKKNISEKVVLINNFFKKYLGTKPRIGITGLNPHCESILKYNEDKRIIQPSVRKLRENGINIKGPFSADTIFLDNNRKKFDVIVGMYHDQVLTPIKTLFGFDAINITIGLPFLRVTPDHGPNEKMLGKNKSSPLSLMNALDFLDNK